MDFPIPELPPVTKATFPSNLPILYNILFFDYFNNFNAVNNCFWK